MSKEPLVLDLLATDENFNEEEYLSVNPDVARALKNGQIESARAHFIAFGKREGRRIRRASDIAQMRAEKLVRLRPHLRIELEHSTSGGKFNFLTEELRTETAIVATDAVSSNSYDPSVIELIERCADGLCLDAGAGKRDIYFPNVVNYEIVDYDTTDIVGVGEELPFKDGTFDGVISVAVLEHVRNPFRCARELIRVLKPGGSLICCVPFLQPLHGYPHHYYNMTHQGLRALFERDLEITDHLVADSLLPVWSLTWMLRNWAAGLPTVSRDKFLNLRVCDLLGRPEEYLDESWVRDLPTEKNFELASGTILFASKPK